MAIRFISNSDTVDDGFQASYTSGIHKSGNMIDLEKVEWVGLLEDYVQKLYGPTGNFLSPNFPENYYSNAEITWLITMSPDEAVLLSLHDCDLEQNFDFVRVYDGPDASSSLIASLTGDIIPYPFRSTDRFMTVVFRSDYSFTQTGFNATYSPTEPGNYSGEQGTIFSPNYPQFYFDFADVIWIIEVDQSYYVNIRFEEFDVEDDWDFLDVYDGSNIATAPLIAQ
ncbi:deleted in malignant brain tumors 1 protein-like [Pecten maximus]|uniref:deleted in malignant brain tumors 1 protein-like n=1 Tax=Pecten maximus TaxID=6579 RepID=UPI001458E65F|nr:deleted in malignant brain tumors 1 protein-like [Pecten maximus]